MGATFRERSDAPAAVLPPEIDDVRPDASLTAPAGRCDPAFAVVDLFGLFAERHASHRLRLARLAAETSRPTGRAQGAGARDFSRRVLLHRSTFADLAYCVIGLTTLGAILGWAVVSTSWISDSVAALLTRGFGPAPQWRAPDWTLNATRTVALFLAYELGFFVDQRSSTAFRRSGNCTRRTTRPKC